MEEKPELPPLPEPLFVVPGSGLRTPMGFSAKQMRDYALAAVLAERKRCIEACTDERVAAEETGRREDFAYNNAIGHCIDAIRKGGQ